IVPHLVLANVAFLKVRQVEVIETTLCLNTLDDFIAVALTIRLDQFLHDLLKVFPLIAREFRHGNSEELTILALKSDLRLARQALLDERHLLLLAIERLVKLIRRHRLWPKHVARMIGCFVEVFRRMTIE